MELLFLFKYGISDLKHMPAGQWSEQVREEGADTEVGGWGGAQGWGGWGVNRGYGKQVECSGSKASEFKGAAFISKCGVARLFGAL
ncbi:hypothetical protein D4764_01G0002230 [Takifugu flavidus]|uniref:Uncharacterized protein n=1 Tax=Takifugu flavidus TaxID=433684 RepID=A0A5C6PNU1_9TELE|nr:hypothetical protein D4764_01G0002230 [Takifugu flavidus]